MRGEAVELPLRPLGRFFEQVIQLSFERAERRLPVLQRVGLRRQRPQLRREMLDSGSELRQFLCAAVQDLHARFRGGDAGLRDLQSFMDCLELLLVHRELIHLALNDLQEAPGVAFLASHVAVERLTGRAPPLRGAWPPPPGCVRACRSFLWHVRPFWILRSPC